MLVGEFGRHASRLARRARPDPGLSDLLRLDILHISNVLEYHMEFLKTFGYIWSSKEVFKAINGRTAHQSDAVKSLWHTSRSDLDRAT
ncbi:hypothetical protein F2Q68_00011764 [Brassica cretica]|uniref:Uncharacterized protein n=1 Tax=Brassica cretica TaxID=69181 RepID=A0A8S9KQK6_BRACR|nr:hypothetical protein F2Q68_00011764 [Brassica cretica]